MGWEAVKAEFAVRFYRWALADFAREIAEGYPLLSTIRGGLTLRLLSVLRSLEKEERLRFSTALVKRFHKGALSILGESLTPEEEEMCRGYLNLILTRSPLEQEILGQASSGRIHLKVNRKGFAAIVKEELRPVLGGTPERWGGGVWRYQTQIGGWTIHTYVDTGARYHQLAYEHSISAAPHVYLREHISVMSWLGGGQTTWDLLTESDMRATARSLALLTSHFINAAPDLLADLTTQGCLG